MHDASLNVSSNVETDFVGSEVAVIGTPNVATGGENMEQQVASPVGQDTVDEDHINYLLSCMNTCIRWISWIGGMLLFRVCRSDLLQTCRLVTCSRS